MPHKSDCAVHNEPAEPNGPCSCAVYRAPTPEEEAACNPQTPRRLERRVRVSCPDGLVLDADVEFEDGEPLRNVLRAVISLESPAARGPDDKRPDGLAYVFLSQFENEIGRVVYSYAKALVGAK